MNLKNIFLILILLRGTSACAQLGLRDTLNRCLQMYQSHVEYWMAANPNPQVLERFQNLFLHAGVRVEHNIPNGTTEVTIKDYNSLLKGFSRNTTLSLQRVMYCRHPKNATLFYIHAKQSYNGAYLPTGQQLPPMYLTWTIKDTLGKYWIASVKKTPAAYAMDALPDDDRDKIPNFCDKCPQVAGAVEDSGADPNETCTGTQQCFTYTVQPPQWEDFSEQIQVKPSRYEVVPETYETITERVMIKPEGKRLIPVPATYETVTETYIEIPERHANDVLEAVDESVIVRPETTKGFFFASTYETVTETIMVKPQRKRYKVSSQQEKGCESCPCEEETIPAEYQKVVKWVTKTPATIREETIPAHYRHITKQKVVQSRDGQLLPAQQATITKERIRTPATYREETIPAEYAVVTRQVLKTAATCKPIHEPTHFVTVRKKRWIRGARYHKVAIPCGQGAFQVKNVDVPAVFEDVKIYDAQGKVVETRKVETVPAHKTYEVVKN